MSGIHAMLLHGGADASFTSFLIYFFLTVKYFFFADKSFYRKEFHTMSNELHFFVWKFRPGCVRKSAWSSVSFDQKWGVLRYLRPIYCYDGR